MTRSFFSCLNLEASLTSELTALVGSSRLLTSAYHLDIHNLQEHLIVSTLRTRGRDTLAHLNPQKSCYLSTRRRGGGGFTSVAGREAWKQYHTYSSITYIINFFNSTLHKHLVPLPTWSPSSGKLASSLWCPFLHTSEAEMIYLN